MSESFDIVLSRLLTPDEIGAALFELLPPGLRIDVRSDMSELPDEPGAIWALVGTTEDPDWPCVFNCLVCRGECGFGPYPDLRIAAWLSRWCGVDSLCSTYEFVGDLDAHDPYWSLACVGGRWHLASTDGTRLMGPYTDGVRRFPGDQKVRLVRPVELPGGVVA